MLVERAALVFLPLGLVSCACLTDNVTTHADAAPRFIPQKQVTPAPQPVRHTPRGQSTAGKMAPKINAKLLEAQAKPDCEVVELQPTEMEPQGTDAGADANLVRIARLELVRDCYREAEQAVRERLEQLQHQVSAIAK